MTEGFDTIYMADFDEITQTSELFLPKSIEDGVYNFYTEVAYDSYYARAGRMIEVGEGDMLEELLDVSFDLASADIENSKDLSAFINFDSFGEIPANVNLTFTILDESGNEVYRDGTNIMVATQQFLKWDYWGLYIPDGDYVAVLDSVYGEGVRNRFSQSFTIRKKAFITGDVIGRLGEGSGLVVLIIIAILIIGLIIYWERNELKNLLYVEEKWIIKYKVSIATVILFAILFGIVFYLKNYYIYLVGLFGIFLVVFLYKALKTRDKSRGFNGIVPKTGRRIVRVRGGPGWFKRMWIRFSENIAEAGKERKEEKGVLAKGPKYRSALMEPESSRKKTSFCFVEFFKKFRLKKKSKVKGAMGAKEKSRKIKNYFVRFYFGVISKAKEIKKEMRMKEIERRKREMFEMRVEAKRKRVEAEKIEKTKRIEAKIAEEKQRTERLKAEEARIIEEKAAGERKRLEILEAKENERRRVREKLVSERKRKVMFRNVSNYFVSLSSRIRVGLKAREMRLEKERKFGLEAKRLELKRLEEEKQIQVLKSRDEAKRRDAERLVLAKRSAKRRKELKRRALMFFSKIRKRLHERNLARKRKEEEGKKEALKLKLKLIETEKEKVELLKLKRLEDEKRERILLREKKMGEEESRKRLEKLERIKEGVEGLEEIEKKTSKFFNVLDAIKKSFRIRPKKKNEELLRPYLKPVPKNVVDNRNRVLEKPYVVPERVSLKEKFFRTFFKKKNPVLDSKNIEEKKEIVREDLPSLVSLDKVSSNKSSSQVFDKQKLDSIIDSLDKEKPLGFKPLPSFTDKIEDVSSESVVPSEQDKKDDSTKYRRNNY